MIRCPYIGTEVCPISNPEKWAGAHYMKALATIQEKDQRIWELEDSLEKLEKAMQRYVNKTRSNGE